MNFGPRAFLKSFDQFEWAVFALLGIIAGGGAGHQRAAQSRARPRCQQ